MSVVNGPRRWRAILLASAACMAAPAFASSPADSPAPQETRVVTYHYDNLRTGWNGSEKDLTPAAVRGGRFKMIASAQLDDLVHAQPLVMTNERIKDKGVHEVAYVATESNTLYAIDAATGAVLRKHNFGPAVPYTSLPNQCTNNGPNLGITSTPVIDQVSGKMFLVTYTYPKGQPTYQLHEVDLVTLEDVVKPVTITAKAKLAGGGTYDFNAGVSRQRPALLYSNGNIYAAFGSFCDSATDVSRGWVLGFSGDDLAPLPDNNLTNSRAHSPDMYFLTSVWMSGAGPAASLDGHVYFVTGNSDYSGTTWSRAHNIEESVVQTSDDLTAIDGLFTPKGPDFGWRDLDKEDNDFGSGGVMLLPSQNGVRNNLAVALGKAGKMYLLNADDLDNHAHGNDRAFDVVDGGACWCAESYYEGSDGLGRVVTSGDNVIRVWKVKPGETPKLEKEVEGGHIQNGQDPGVFTAVSSDSRKENTAVIWAAGRPVDFDPGTFKLFAFDATSGKRLFAGDAGVWPFPDNNATVMPVVANGKVLVAGYKTLSIFGLSDSPAAPLPRAMAPDTRAKLAPGEHEIHGTVRAIQGTLLSVQKRDGSTVTVDVSRADARHDKAEPQVGKALLARGFYGAGGVMEASAVLHAKNSPQMWYPDR